MDVGEVSLTWTSETGPYPRGIDLTALVWKRHRDGGIGELGVRDEQV